MHNQERRQGTRKPLNFTAMLTHDTGHRMCRLRELSVSGAMLDVGWGALTHDVPVQLMFDLPDASGVRGYVLPATVARVTTGGTALRFAGLDSDTQQALTRFLQAH